MALERAHERALAAFGAQVGVHLEAGLAQMRITRPASRAVAASAGSATNTTSTSLT